MKMKNAKCKTKTAKLYPSFALAVLIGCSLAGSACSSGSRGENLQEILRQRQAVVNAMVEEAATFKFKACDEGTECYARIRSYAARINELNELIVEIDPAAVPWQDGLSGLIDPRSEPDGTLTQYQDNVQRQGLHERLVAATLEQVKPDDDLDAIFTMGGPGSGKTTLLNKLGLCDEDFVRINSDEFKEDLVEYQVAVAARDRLASDRVHRESSMLAKRARAEAIKSHRDFCFDGTLSKRQPTLQLIEQLKAEGYDVTVVVVALPVEVGLQRVQSRAVITGRFVPADFVRKSYEAISQHSEEVLQAADQGYIYDNNVGIQEPPRLLAQYVNGVLVKADSASSWRVN